MARFIGRALVFALLTLFWSLVAIPALLFNRRGVAVSGVARLWARTILRASGVEVDVEGLEQHLGASAYLVMANHTSHFDVPSLFASLPLSIHPVAKRELGYIPVFGWVLALGAAIMIDRGDRERAIRSIERAGRSIRAGRTVLMFPEGTRTPPGELGPLKKGPFHLALSARVPILPVGITGTGDILLPGDWRIRPGKVRVRVGNPIATTDRPDTEAGRAGLEAEVAAALKSLMTPSIQT